MARPSTKSMHDFIDLHAHHLAESWEQHGWPVLVEDDRHAISESLKVILYSCLKNLSVVIENEERRITLRSKYE